MLYQDLSDSGKKYIRIMAFVLAAIVVVFGVVFTAYYYASWKQVRHATKNFQISVSGEGKVSAKPDVATFTFSVRAEQTKLKSAQDENSASSARVVQFLKSSGVADKDIRTTYYTISPQYQYPRPCPLSAAYPCTTIAKPTIVGYVVVSSYEVKLRDLGRAGDILDGVTSAGATEVNGPSFTLDNPDTAKAEARKKAIDNAKEKAGVLANDLGVRLGDIVGFNESGGGYPIMFQEKSAVLGLGGGATAPMPSIQTGENEITSNITITYEIR